MLVCYQLIHRTVIFKVRAANTGSLVYSPASLSLSSCSRPDSVLTVCVVESVLHVWDIWVMCLELSPTPNNNWVTLRMNAANPSVLSVYMLSNAMMRRVLWRSITWAAAACSSQGRKWKDLHPSVQMWVRERSLENWERAGEREREREGGNGEWALSFEGRGGKSESRLHGWCLLLRSERWGVWWGERSSSLSECVQTACWLHVSTLLSAFKNKRNLVFVIL